MILYFGKRKQLLMSLYRFDRKKKYLLRYAKARRVVAKKLSGLWEVCCGFEGG